MVLHNNLVFLIFGCYIPIILSCPTLIANLTARISQIAAIYSKQYYPATHIKFQVHTKSQPKSSAISRLCTELIHVIITVQLLISRYIQAIQIPRSQQLARQIPSKQRITKNYQEILKPTCCIYQNYCRK